MKKNIINIIINTIKTSIKMEKKYFFSLVILNTLVVLLSVLSIINTQIIVNNMQMGIDFYSADFLFPLARYPLIIIFSELITQLIQYLTQRYSDVLNYRYSMLQLNVINEQNLETFENPQFYDLVQRAEYAGGIYPYKIMNSIVVLFSEIISSITFILILINWHWWSILFIAIFPVLSGFQMIRLGIDEYRIRYNRTTYERASWYYAHLLNKDINIKETKLFALENIFLNKFKSIREKFLNENNLMYRKRMFTNFIIQFFSIIATSVIVIMVFYDASRGLILIGSLMTYINAVSNTKNSFSRIFSTIFDLHQDALHVGDIVQLLQYKLRKDNQNNDLQNISTIDEVVFKNVSFKYRGSTNYALKNINLNFKRGKKYVITGRNGSGKSTLIKLILGLYDQYEGEILINGIELRDIDQNSYKKLVTAIFQDFTKYQFITKDAISISDYEKRNHIEKVVESSNYASADFIEKLPHKFEQQVGSWFDGGIQLSGGEWQKLAIARSFFREDSCMVAMDEPSASLDPISENKIYKNFQRLCENKIGLFITHRLKNFNLEEEIIFMENGNIVEKGQIDKLLKSDGKFAEFYNISNIISKGKYSD